jgi:hypothetical protein
VEWARRRVDTALVKPLAKQEQAGSRFSRSRQPPRERRVRVTQSTASVDKRGNAFVAFAIDVRFVSSDWHQDDITGCAYRGSGELFVKNGDTYLPAAFLLGKDVESVPGACEAAPPPA